MGSVLLTFGLVLAACNGGDDGAATTATTGATTTAPAGGASATTAAKPDGAAIAIVLGPGRLTVGGNALVFTAPQSQVSSYLERALGEPTVDEDLTCDAGRLRALGWPGLTAYVADDGFAGWDADDDTYATAKGLRVGATTASVQAAHPDVQIQESSLGTELFVPDDGDGDEAGLSGILEGGRIARLWSGATCVAR